jgi:hypothetical protein
VLQDLGAAHVAAPSRFGLGTRPERAAACSGRRAAALAAYLPMGAPARRKTSRAEQFIVARFRCVPIVQGAINERLQPRKLVRRCVVACFAETQVASPRRPIGVLRRL